MICKIYFEGGAGQEERGGARAHRITREAAGAGGKAAVGVAGSIRMPCDRRAQGQTRLPL